jgi:hypothetical protein
MLSVFSVLLLLLEKSIKTMKTTSYRAEGVKISGNIAWMK